MCGALGSMHNTDAQVHEIGREKRNDAEDIIHVESLWEEHEGEQHCQGFPRRANRSGGPCAKLLGECAVGYGAGQERDGPDQEQGQRCGRRGEVCGGRPQLPVQGDHGEHKAGPNAVGEKHRLADGDVMVLQDALLEVPLQGRQEQLHEREREPEGVEVQGDRALAQGHERRRCHQQRGSGPLSTADAPPQPQHRQHQCWQQLAALQYGGGCVVQVPDGDFAERLRHSQAHGRPDVQRKRHPPLHGSCQAFATCPLHGRPSSKAGQLDQRHAPVEIEARQRLEYPFFDVAA
mmetsp:Transcript_104545/g.295836  ORF Transcript_104545/g.295836 Transcript_104545/m.295836 type:complete len:291 (-) Transcript_104545:100-972(-)